jgi:hypothetical protein
MSKSAIARLEGNGSMKFAMEVYEEGRPENPCADNLRCWVAGTATMDLEQSGL